MSQPVAIRVKKVIIIAKKHFNRELDEYVNRRRSPGQKSMLKFRLSMGKPSDDEVPDLKPKKVHVVYSKPTFWERLSGKGKTEPFTQKKEKPTYMKGQNQLSDQEMAKLKAQIETEEQEEKAAPKKGFFAKLGSFFANSEPEHMDMTDSEAEQEQSLDPETIEVLKICGRWITKLDNEQKKAFRDSQDYAVYKAFLDKYGLSKKK